MGNVQIPSLLKEISAVFTAKGHSVYLVGGAVRDILMGKTPHDWDLATSARPEQVQSLFRRVIPTGIKHGTVTILFKGESLETTTFRTEAGYTDSRHPDHIAFAATIEEDLSRRDFTMNAIAVELETGTIVDPFKGTEDISTKIIRCVGDPRERFGEDGLRALRAARFSAQLGFEIEKNTKTAISERLDTTAAVAEERIQAELDKLLASPQPSVGFRAMEETGLLSLLFRELAICRGIEQKGMHRFDVLDHLLATCDAAPRDSRVLRLAALLHDTGKPSTRALGNDGVWTFYGHEAVSARIAEGFLKRLRYPTAVTEEVTHLVSEHMFHYEAIWSDAAVRRFVQRVKLECLPDLFALRLADLEGMEGIRPAEGELTPLKERIEAVLAKGRALSIKDLAITGNDLMLLGVEKGPKIGSLLKKLLEMVIEEPDLNTKERLLAAVDQLTKASS